MSNRSTALITGASGGIGLELAKRFAQDGCKIILVARNEAKLHAAASLLREQYRVETQIIIKDLSDPTAAQEIFNQLSNTPVDILVNNAGFGLSGHFKDTDLSVETDMVQVNITSLMALTKLFLPHMITHGSGRVLNIASTAAFQPGPTMAVYFATKAFVLHFSEAIANELKDTGVTVTALCPGPTQTNFEIAAGNVHLFKGSSMNAEDVAEVGYRATMAGKSVAVAGIQNKLTSWGSKFAPRSLSTAMVRKLME